ncbi:hypothetical protein KC19_VG289400 [Ceratodon purpureus]|uniref:Uncharacterized protein n=1 Tax=Ceratodon purpureus TaxID=3225 RepID=A0A8T0HWH3_CERPU|nr:hypothetical protein KC19_VG289400 [Ceratodon purpureus]
MTCPVYGITEEELRRECASSLNLRRALIVFIEEGQYQYGGLGFALGESLRREVVAKMEEVRDGTGDGVVQSVMRWVRYVQLCALHDLAVCEPMRFNLSWQVTNHEHWNEMAKQ